AKARPGELAVANQSPHREGTRRGPGLPTQSRAATPRAALATPLNAAEADAERWNSCSQQSFLSAQPPFEANQTQDRAEDPPAIPYRLLAMGNLARSLPALHNFRQACHVLAGEHCPAADLCQFAHRLRIGAQILVLNRSADYFDVLRKFSRFADIVLESNAVAAGRERAGLTNERLAAL